MRNGGKSGARRQRLVLMAGAAVLLAGTAMLPSLLALSGRGAEEPARNTRADAGVGLLPNEAEAARPLAAIAPAARPAAQPSALPPPEAPAEAAAEAAAEAPAEQLASIASEPTAAPDQPASPPGKAAGGAAPESEAAPPTGETAWWRVGGDDDPSYGRKYYIVIGSLRDPARARSLAARHEDWQPMIAEARVEGQPRQRVIVGPFHWRDIEAARRRIVAAGIRDAWPLPADDETVPRTLAALALGE